MAKFDPYRKWLGIPSEEQPPNHYRLLGVGLFESDPDVISNAADRQMVHVRSFHTGQHARLSQQVLNELSAARVCLLDAEKRAAYDQQLRATISPALQSGPPPPRASQPPPRQGGSGPPIAAVSDAAAAFAPSVRPSERVVRRKKISWLVPLIALVLLAIAIALLALLLDG